MPVRLALAALAFLTLNAGAASPEKDRKAPVVKSETIDVSSYPKAQRENYKLFAAKCATCHVLPHVVIASYALPAEFRAEVMKMKRRKNSGIDAKTAERIIEFLIYDASVRKKDLIAEKTRLAAEQAKSESDQR